MNPIALLLACALLGAACSRSEKKPELTRAATPPPNLAADAARLQQATANALAEHERAAAKASPSPTTPPHQP